MQQREWQTLGQALKDLRTGLDMAQKEVVNRIGEELGERALRSYESGEQRPSRERLLRLLTKSFELRAAAEINRYLDLGRYAALNLSEILQLGLESAPVEVRLNRSRPGPPVDFRAEVSTLIVADAEGKEVWRHRFPARFAQRAYDGSDSLKRCSFGDIDGDGRVETIFSYLPLDFGSVGSTLYCFAEDGTVKWEFVPGRMVQDTTGREYWPPYTTSIVQVIPLPGSETRIMVSSNHYLHNANQIAMLDPRGNQISEYWHSGHLR